GLLPRSLAAQSCFCGRPRQSGQPVQGAREAGRSFGRLSDAIVASAGFGVGPLEPGAGLAAKGRLHPGLLRIRMALEAEADAAATVSPAGLGRPASGRPNTLA